MGRWVTVPLDAPVYKNVDETQLSNAQARLENAYQTEAKGHTRFPGLKLWADLPSDGRVYPFAWNDDLIATTSKGRVYRIGKDMTVVDVTGSPISGGRRVVSDETPDRIVFAAGGPIISYDGTPTKILSQDAPTTTHVVYLDGFLLAIEPGAQRFRYCEAGNFESWPAINTISAEAHHDPLTAVAATEFGELFLCGPKSIEQFERNTNSTTQPFYRRWRVGAGLYAPYTLVPADNAMWCLTDKRELSRLSGQIAQPASVPIQDLIERIDDTSEAWSSEMASRGNRFIIVQFPNATNEHDTKGVTIAYDFRQRKFCFLYGWDEAAASPGRWPGWGVVEQWGQVFVGGEGAIYQLDADNYAQDAGTQVMAWRSGHFDMRGAKRIVDARFRMKRGHAPNADVVMQFRVNRDNGGWRPWMKKPLGEAGSREMYVSFGQLGNADTWQFEYRISAALAVEIVKFEIEVEDLHH